MIIKLNNEPGSQAAYFRNHAGKHLCEVVEMPARGSMWVWVRYPDEAEPHDCWTVTVRDVTPIGDVAKAMLECAQ